MRKIIVSVVMVLVVCGSCQLLLSLVRSVQSSGIFDFDSERARLLAQQEEEEGHAMIMRAVDMRTAIELLPQGCDKTQKLTMLQELDQLLMLLEIQLRNPSQRRRDDPIFRMSIRRTAEKRAEIAAEIAALGDP